MALKETTMNTKQSIELYKSTQKFLDDLNAQMRSAVYEAIDQAAKDLGKDSYYFHGLHEWMRAPFGHKPTGVEAIEAIKESLTTENAKMRFREDAFMGSSHYYDYPTEEIKVIAKYL